MNAAAPRVHCFEPIDYRALSHVELMRCCMRAGADEAWSEFTSRYNRFVCLAVLRAYADRGGWRVSGVNVDQVDDLVQEVYLKLLESSRSALGGFRGASDASVFVYIGRVAISVVVDHLRRNGARKRASETCSLDAPVYGQEGRELTLGDLLASGDPGPEHEALAAILREEVTAILERVLRGRNGARDAEIAAAFIFEGASLHELAEAQGGRMGESGVKSSIRRSCLRLRAELGRLELLASSRRARAAALREEFARA